MIQQTFHFRLLSIWHNSREESDGKRAQKKASTSNLRLSAEGSTLPILNTFEARLGSLEALLRDVPPDVHNALISRLDASLNAGPGESSSMTSKVLKKASSRAMAKMPERNAASGLEEIQRSLQGLNLSNGYLYLDEIGQTKWQGKSNIKEAYVPRLTLYGHFRSHVRLSAARSADGSCSKQWCCGA